MIDRFETDNLIEMIGFFPVIGIVGPRQVGKTTIAKQISSALKKDTLYIDLENPRDQAKLTDPVLFFEGKENVCVILDEIQRVPSLFPVLRSMVDLHRVPARFILLGSASPELIRDASESLAGRIAYKELTPFNLTEIGNDEWQKHWLRGGFPSAFLAPSDKLCFKWQFNFIQTYIERDLPLLGFGIDRNVIRKLWTMIAHIHGNILNMSTIARSLELDSKTIKRYLSFLEEAFLIRQLKPYSVNIKKRLIKSPKIYVRDSGILHQILGVQSFGDLEGNPVLGNSWEGYAIEQIIQRMSEDINPYFYRTHEGAECDLILEKGGKPLFSIEIKYSSSPKLSKGNKQSFADLGTTKNFIITPNTDDYVIAENIRVCNLHDFISNYLPIR